MAHVHLVYALGGQRTEPERICRGWKTQTKMLRTMLHELENKSDFNYNFPPAFFDRALHRLYGLPELDATPRKEKYVVGCAQVMRTHINNNINRNSEMEMNKCQMCVAQDAQMESGIYGFCVVRHSTGILYSVCDATTFLVVFLCYLGLLKAPRMHLRKFARIFVSCRMAAKSEI